MPMTALPEAPSRAVPATFSAKADALLGALSTFVTQANALEANINLKESEYIAAANSAALAAASANFKGAWASLTGAAAIPYSVSHLGRYWMLITATSNIAADIPGTSAKWQEIGNVTQQDFNAKTNPLALSQGIHLTAAASGSSGIQVADNDNIDFGTGNFTLVWKGSLPDWKVATNFFTKRAATADRWQSSVAVTSGYLTYYHAQTGATTVNIATTSAPSLINGTTHEIIIVITRETATVAGSVSFYVDGVLFETVVINSGGTPANISNAVGLLISGYVDIRYAGTVQAATLFNRALTAAEVLALYRNGVNFADKWGSQTELMPNQVDRDFSGASAWADVDLAGGGGAYDETDDLTITAGAAGAGDYCTCPVASIPTTIGYKYRLKFDVANLVGTWTIKSFDGTQTIGTVSATGLQQPFEWVATTTGGLRLVAVSNLASGDFDNFTLVKLGATIDLELEGAQPAPGQWLDASSNKLHAMQPAAGSSLVRFKKEFEFRWTNIWTASAAAQYIGGLNQAILSAKHFIASIVSRATVLTDIETIQIGDGSAVAYYVASIAPTAAPIIHTLAKNLNDGTNLKLVVTPVASATMTVEFIVRGYLLE